MNFTPVLNSKYSTPRNLKAALIETPCYIPKLYLATNRKSPSPVEEFIVEERSHEKEIIKNGNMQFITNNLSKCHSYEHNNFQSGLNL